MSKEYDSFRNEKDILLAVEDLLSKAQDLLVENNNVYKNVNVDKKIEQVMFKLKEILNEEKILQEKKEQLILEEIRLSKPIYDYIAENKEKVAGFQSFYLPDSLLTGCGYVSFTTCYNNYIYDLTLEIHTQYIVCYIHSPSTDYFKNYDLNYALRHVLKSLNNELPDNMSFVFCDYEGEFMMTMGEYINHENIREDFIPILNNAIYKLDNIIEKVKEAIKHDSIFLNSIKRKGQHNG